ncbi:MAG: helix-turn-helix domain-containing protein [Alkalinema sp. RU_4_3]|nr:helix-turn-helix domain-containing protein [Alkalinema sp. RU_4_3]
MGEVRDRGVILTSAGQALLKEALSEMRDENGKKWTLSRLGLEAGVHEKTVSRLINGTKSVDEGTARSIAQVLKVPFQDLEPFVEQTRTEADKPGTLSENPFTFGSPVTADRFYGRSRTIADLKSRIGARSPQCVNLVGLRRSGKSSMLQYVKAKPEMFFAAGQHPLIVYLDLQDGRYHSPDGLLEGLRDGIAGLMREEPWGKNGDAFAIEDGLERVRDRGWRLIVMLDELEAIGKRLAEFEDWGEDWRSKASAGLFSLVIATKRPLGEVYGSLGLTSPFDNIFSKTMLGALEPEDWRGLVTDGLAGIDGKALGWIDRMSGGWAYYVQMAAAMVWQYGDLGEAEREFRYQAEDRFRELWKDLGAEQGALRGLVLNGKAIDPRTGLGDRLFRYGVLRSDGRFFSEAFGDWIRENGGAV